MIFGVTCNYVRWLCGFLEDDLCFCGMSIFGGSPVFMWDFYMDLFRVSCVFVECRFFLKVPFCLNFLGSPLFAWDCDCGFLGSPAFLWQGIFLRSPV